MAKERRVPRSRQAVTRFTLLAFGPCRGTLTVANSSFTTLARHNQDPGSMLKGARRPGPSLLLCTRNQDELEYHVPTIVPPLEPGPAGLVRSTTSRLGSPTSHSRS
eukprot:318660-Rhodomonas_salina.1